MSSSTCRNNEGFSCAPQQAGRQAPRNPIAHKQVQLTPGLWMQYWYNPKSCSQLLGLCTLETQTWVSLVAQSVKRLSTMRETWVPSLGREDSLETFSIVAVYRAVLLAPRGWRPRVILSFPQYTGQPPKRTTMGTKCHSDNPSLGCSAWEGS